MRIESGQLSLGVKHNAESTDSHREKVEVLVRPVPRAVSAQVTTVASAPVDVTDLTVALTPKQMRDLAVIEEMLSRLMAMPVKLRPLRIGPIAAPAKPSVGTVTFGDGSTTPMQLASGAMPGRLPAVSVRGSEVRFTPEPEQLLTGSRQDIAEEAHLVDITG